MKKRLYRPPWSKKSRTPNQGLKGEEKNGACVHLKTSEQKEDVDQTNPLSNQGKSFLNVEDSGSEKEKQIKKPWSERLKGLVIWLTILKLIVMIVKEILQIFT
jgi:hypothetical protein